MSSQMLKRENEWWEPLGGRVYGLRHQVMYGEAVGIYLIDTRDQLLIVDGPHAQDGLIEALKAIDKPVTIVLTHGPAFNRSDRLVQALGATVLVHKQDRSNEWLGKNRMYCEFWEGESHQMTPDITLYHSGGHSGGHCLIYDAESPGFLFTGDEIYADSQGRLQLENELRREPLRSNYLRKLGTIIAGLTFEHSLPLHGEAFSDAAARITATFLS
jgi:glyoxylase-like metal-dependent hydrolase (beta-lactamase superfamily II)